MNILSNKFLHRVICTHSITALLSVAGACLTGFAMGATTQTLTFIPGPAGTANDPTIPIGSPRGGEFVVISADLRGNGRRDLILGIGNAPPITGVLPMRVLRANQAGTALTDVTRQLFGQGELPSMQHPREIALGDFNRDGKLDIFVAAHGYDAPPFPGERNVFLTSSPDGTYADRSASLPSAPDFTHHAAVGDIDGDGIPDIFVGNLPVPIRAYFLIGQGDGTFRQATDLIPPDVITPNGSTFLASTLVDLDGDGAPDLVLASSGDGNGRNLILFNDGTGNFTRRARSELPIGIFGPTATMNDVVALDINGDGMIDLLFLSTQSGALQDKGAAIQVLINRGNGVFTDETTAILGASASRTNGIWWTFLRTADINGDGLLDFYATGSQQIDNNGQVSLSIPMIWLNNGNGTFTAVNSDIFPNVGSRLEVMDVDGDGRLDFVTAYINGNGIMQYRTFLNRTPRTVPSEPILATAVVGNALATISFTAPLGSGTSPVTGYTAVCSRAFASAVTRTGTTSPIVVTGLTNGKSYTCSVAATNTAGNSLPSQTVSVTPSANYQGLWWNSPAASESGWGINFAHQGEVIFATWFTYDTSGKALWLSMTASQSGADYVGTLYQTRGPAFNAVPFNPSGVTATAIGSGNLSFSDDSNGRFAYVVNGSAQTKVITRQVFGPLPTCTFGAQSNLALATNYQDLWWAAPGGSESGWGVNFTHQGDTIFATWFTYDTDGAPLWLSATAAKTGARIYQGTLYQTTGPAFNAVPFLPANIGLTSVGSLTLTFATGNSATFAYTLNGITQSKPIVRQVFRAPGTVCQ